MVKKIEPESSGAEKWFDRFMKLDSPKIIPVKKGDILRLAARSVGKNGDFMFIKDGYRLFLKNKNPERQKDLNTKDIDQIPLNTMIKIRVVKVFDTLGYVELVKD